MEKNAGREFAGVEATMLLPLWGRYSESRKAGGLVKDGKCEEIVAKAGFDFSSLEAKQNPASRLAWVARAWNVDRELEKAAAGGPFTVVCLGCGLDTAFYRQRLPGLVRWYDVDLPNVIEVRRRLVGEAPRCVTVAGSVLHAETYGNIRVEGGLFVLAVGLLYYFTEDDVRRVLSHVAGLAPEAGIVIDYCSAQGVAIANRMVIQDCSGARMIWSAEGEDDIRKLHPAVRAVETYPVFAKIRSLLTGEEAKAAEISDRMRIMSFAAVKLGRVAG